MIWLQNVVKSGTAVVDDFHANSPVKIKLHVSDYIWSSNEVWVALHLVHDGCHNLLKLGGSTSTKAIIDSSRDTIMQVNIGRGHVGHLNHVECQKKKSVCGSCDPGADALEGIRMKRVNCVRALSEVDYQLFILWLDTDCSKFRISWPPNQRHCKSKRDARLRTEDCKSCSCGCCCDVYVLGLMLILNIWCLCWSWYPC